MNQYWSYEKEGGGMDEFDDNNDIDEAAEIKKEKYNEK